MVEATHRQVCIPLLREMARELRHQRGEVTCHHELPISAVIINRAAHSLLPLVAVKAAREALIMQSQEAGRSLQAVDKLEHFVSPTRALCIIVRSA